MSCCSVEEDSSYGQSTALVEACKNRDVAMVDLLLKHGSRDDDCKALAIAVQNKDETLTAKLLSTKVTIQEIAVCVCLLAKIILGSS